MTPRPRAAGAGVRPPPADPAAWTNPKPSTNGVHPPPGPPPDAAPLAGRTLDTVEALPVAWLWPGRVPFGMLAILDGDAGLGKSAIAFDLAARLTRGGPMPFAADPPHPPAGVLLLCAEDSAAHTLRPRLEAAGADLARVVIPGEDAIVVIPGDLPAVEALMVGHGVRLVVVDPVMAFLAGGIDSNNDQSARQALTPLKRLAERTGAAVLLIRHLNKKDGQGAAYRGGGSVAFTATTRSALVVGRDPADPGVSVLAGVKCNVGKLAAAAAYAVEDRDGMPVIAWGELRPDLSADDVCTRPQPAGPNRQAAKTGDARDWLADRLAGGPVPKGDLEAAAEVAGHRPRTLQRAAEELGVDARRVGFPARTVWDLPASRATRGGSGGEMARLGPDPPESLEIVAAASRAKGSSGELARLGTGADGATGADAPDAVVPPTAAPAVPPPPKARVTRRPDDRGGPGEADAGGGA